MRDIGQKELAAEVARMTTQTIERPEIVDDDHLYYLDLLRETGVTNMFGATPYLREEYPDLSRDEAQEILIYWMKTFGERH